MLLAPNALIQKRYRIVRLIAQGGMGAVYQATDLRLGNTVALKQTLVQSPQLREAFEYEARLLANLHHPALPLVSDHFVEGNEQFLVMQFIPGDDLEALLQQNGRPFALDDVLRWADRLLDALDYLHAQQPPIIHRDIKPQNLKLTPRGDIILLDFGLAKGIPAPTQTSGTGQSVYGYTPHYGPLEQIQGTGTDTRTDLYSLGATLYHLLTGQMPPDALSRAAAVVRGEPDPIRTADVINSQIPPDVADVLHQAMAHNPAYRPADAAAMRAMLKQAKRTSPTAPSPTLRIDSSGKPTMLVSQPQAQAAPTPVAQSAGTPHSPSSAPAPARPIRQSGTTCFSVMLALGAAIVTASLFAAFLLALPAPRQAGIPTPTPMLFSGDFVLRTPTLAPLSETIPAPSREADPQAPGMRRTNPFPFGEVATLPDWDIEVQETVRGDAALQRLRADNSYTNIPDVEGMEYFLVKLEARATFTDDNQRQISGSQFAVTGSNGVEYGWFPVAPPDPSLDGELFAGGRLAGWIAFLIRADEESLILVKRNFMNLDGHGPRYIALEEGAATSVNQEIERSAPNTLGISRQNPAPVGETVVADEWEIAIRDTVRGDAAWQLIQASDEYAQPPSAGQEYIAVKLAIRYFGTVNETEFISSLDVVGSENVVYKSAFDARVHPEMNVDFYHGGVFEGWIVVRAAAGETQLALIFSPDYLEEDRRYLSLEDS